MKKMYKGKKRGSIYLFFAKFRTDFFFSLPMCLYILLFAYTPLVGIIIAFKTFQFDLGMWKSPWCGLTNFKIIFSGTDSVRMFRNTLGYNAVFIIGGVLLGVLIAIMLSMVTKRWHVKVYQTVLLLPYFVSWVVVAYIVFAFLSNNYGILNNLLAKFGVDKIKWYSKPKPWVFITIIGWAWKSVGYTSLLYYAAIIGIDSSYYEAASLDGAKLRHMVRYIILPELASLICILVILDVGKMFNSDFGLFYQLNKGEAALYPTTQVLDTYIYRALADTSDLGVSTAGSFFKSCMGLILVTATNAIVKKIDPDKALY